jgi:hypothetical protein
LFFALGDTACKHGVTGSKCCSSELVKVLGWRGGPLARIGIDSIADHLVILELQHLRLECCELRF